MREASCLHKLLGRLGNEENFLHGDAITERRYFFVGELFDQQLTRCGWL